MKQTNFMLLLVFALAGIFVTTTSCKAERGMQDNGIGSAEFTTVQVSSFDKLKFDGPVMLTLIPGNADIQVETDNCNLRFNGPTASVVTYKGNEARVVLNGPGTLSLDVDCDKVKSVCNGPGVIKVKGTANESRVNMNAVGRIDTSELNKL